MGASMNPCYEPPNLGSRFQQAHAGPGRQIVSTVEEIIETGAQSA